MLTPSPYHTALRLENMAKSEGLSVTLSVESPPFPYGIAYRRSHEIFDSGLFKNYLCKECTL